MQESQILSTQTAPPTEPHPQGLLAGRAFVFDACHTGVVLRSVLFVETTLSAGVMFIAETPLAWLTQVCLLTGGVLPATLAWLLTACSLKKMLQRLSIVQQYAAGVLLGAVSGLYACGILTLIGLAADPRWLASAAAGALLSAALVAGLVMRARAQTPATTTARLTELQSRIRPHFLFNTLNSAIALVRAEPAKAESLLEDLSDLFRHALVEQGESVTLREEITLARRYLDIEQVRFEDRLQVQWSLDERANGARMPPLLLQPLVENAVKHGVETCARGGKVRISTKLHGSRVVISITNTVPMVPLDIGARSGHGIALDNVRARLQLMHDVECSFTAGMHNGLYKVRISLSASSS
ncbi:MAG: sensor histidine kinase [Comamonadaceae bacterium]|nr:MAG: sensor histidine kinase [Comamonadaceae bacterium]